MARVKSYNIRLNKSKILANDFCIINQSPTGLFEKKVYLNKQVKDLLK